MPDDKIPLDHFPLVGRIPPPIEQHEPTQPATDAITMFGPDAVGRRSSQFTHGKCCVLVSPEDADDNERAFAFAGQLANAGVTFARAMEVTAELRAKVAKQAKELAELRLRVKPDPIRLLGPGCVRFRDGKVWLLNSQREGWSAFGIPCASWDALFRRFNVIVTTDGHDVWGDYWIVDNVPADEAEVATIRNTPAFR